MKKFITSAIGASRLALKAHGPTLMVIGGVTAMGAGTIYACKKTLQLEEVLQPHAEALDSIESQVVKAKDFPRSTFKYDDKQAKKDRHSVYVGVAKDSVKHYFVPGTLFIGGAALVFGGHRIMLQRNATLAIAFTSLKKLHDAYRANVVQQFGSEVDQGMMSGHVMREVVDPETGEKALVHGRDWDAAQDEPYNRVFDQYTSTQWYDDLGVNKLFLSNQMRKANILLGLQGYLYLSDVYKSLGIEESDISRVVGWKVERLPDGTKSIPFVDFGLDKPHPDDWKYNQDKAIYLDFNCTGLIIGGKVQKILENA